MPSWTWTLLPPLVSNLPFHVQLVALDGRVDRSRLDENVLLLWLVKLLFTNHNEKVDQTSHDNREAIARSAGPSPSGAYSKRVAVFSSRRPR